MRFDSERFVNISESNRIEISGGSILERIRSGIYEFENVDSPGAAVSKIGGTSLVFGYAIVGVTDDGGRG